MSEPRTVDDVLRDVDEVTDGLDPMQRIVWLEELAARLESRIDTTAHDQAAELMEPDGHHFRALTARPLMVGEWRSVVDQMGVAVAAEEQTSRLFAAMSDYITVNGIEHDDPDCPEDDTCECVTVAALNLALAGALRTAERVDARKKAGR